MRTQMELTVFLAASCVIGIAIIVIRRRRKSTMFVRRDRQIQAFPPGYRSKGR
jgi:hypothetical protein